MVDLYNTFIFPHDYTEYCRGVHPALKVSFKVLCEELQKRVDLGLISSSKKGDLEIFKYTQEAVCERQWDYFTLMARGLVLSSEKVVGLCFPKFFNYGEQIPIHYFAGKSFLAAEKKDGSLGICFWHNDEWVICTCGSFISEQAQWANCYFQKKINYDSLRKGTTYLFEIIYPENRIVVPYTEDSLSLLSAYEENGYEIDREELDNVAKQVNFERPEVYIFDDLDEVLKETALIDHTREGFVVRFKSGVRVKIKGDEYCRIHKLISRVTPIAVWEMLVSDDDMEDAKNDLPEEMEKDYEQIISVLTAKKQETLGIIERLYEETKHMSDKELGLELANKKSKIFEDKDARQYKNYIFARRKTSYFEELNNVGSLLRNSVFKQFRPKSNFLEGYSPSSAMNRFNDG